MPKLNIPFVQVPCGTCTTDVPIRLGDAPPIPVRCEQHRERPVVRTVRCSFATCSNTTSITGRQARRWELGRPVYCSTACRHDGTRVHTRCATCDVELVLAQNRASRRERSFCSPECAWAGQVKDRPTITCENCGTSFVTDSTRPSRPRRRFCGKRCANIGNSPRRLKTTRERARA